MMIGFTKKTSKLLPRIFCRRFCHCAIVIEIFESKKFVFLHKVSGKIHMLEISARDIKLLEESGWVFIKLHSSKNKLRLNKNCGTCVGFVKRAAGIHKPLIWTPYQLHRHLKKLS